MMEESVELMNAIRSNPAERYAMLEKSPSFDL